MVEKQTNEAESLYVDVQAFWEQLKTVDADFPQSGELRSVREIEEFCDLHLQRKQKDLQFEEHPKENLEIHIESTEDDAENNQARKIIERLIEKINFNFAEFYEKQRDLPGINHLVRVGLVKEVELEGQKFILKRNNPSKPGRFLKEQENIQKIREKFMNGPFEFERADGRKMTLQTIESIGSIADKNGAETNHYSVSKYQPGKTLEEILLNETDTEKRKLYLEDTKNIFETIGRLGIYWGDMAPRNIVVNEMEDEVAYFILDFEKTEVLEQELSDEEKNSLCRGPMTIEEFGAICELDELKIVFNGYFEPENWDTDSEDPIKLTKPKRELLAIFKERGVNQVTEGAYNKLDREVMGVRLPYFESAKKYFPLNVNFKIDHYSGADYDRKVTEIFLKAKQFGLLSRVVSYLDRFLLAYEEQMTVRGIFTRLGSEKGQVEENRLKLGIEKVIDELFKICAEPEIFSAKLAEIERFQVRSEADLNLIERYFENQELARDLNSLRSNLRAKSLTAVVVASGASEEFNDQSDIDLVLIGEQDNISSLLEELEQLSEFELEISSFASFEKLKEAILADPEYLLDFYAYLILSDKPKQKEILEKLIAELFKDEELKQKIKNILLQQFQQFWHNYQGVLFAKNEFGMQDVKILLKAIKFLYRIGANVPEEINAFFQRLVVMKQTRGISLGLGDKHLIQEIEVLLKDSI